LTTIEIYYKIYAGKVSLTDVLDLSKKALALLPQGDSFWPMATTVVCGDALFFFGEFKKAHQYYLKAYSINIDNHNPYFILSTGTKVAITLFKLGKLGETEELFLKLIQLIY
jgi:tetratricopeptide (TPR) repeat protein